jgi:hypothetical protein
MKSLRCAPFLLIAFLAGCGEHHFRSETVWRPDGRVERAVYQPGEFFPEHARTGWQTFRRTAEIRSDAFTGSIRELPESDGEPIYFAAWGTFLSPDALPSHVLFVGADPAKTSQLERTTSVNRLGLVTEYVWRERLTDAISLADMQLARREAATLAADLVEAALHDGRLRYDISGLLRWLRSDAVALFDEMHGLFVEAMIRGETEGEAGVRLAEGLADAAAKYGLNFRTDDGKLVEGNSIDDAFDRFLVAKLRETVRTPSGERIDEATARQLLAKLGLIWDGSSLNWNPTPDSQRAIAARFGKEEAAKAKAAELATRLFGVHHAGILTTPSRFHYELTLPGSVVETTGERIGESRVVWRFDAARAFPLGYDMNARSLTPNEPAQKALLGSVRLTSLEQLADYATLVKSDAGLAALMERSVASGSLKPLDDYAAELATQSNVDPSLLARVTRLKKVLSR